MEAARDSKLPWVLKPVGGLLSILSALSLLGGVAAIAMAFGNKEIS